MLIVGVLMMAQLKDVQWDNVVAVSSVFMTIIMMILSCSISVGIAWGFVTYTVATIATGKFREMNWRIYVLVIIFGIYLFFGI